MGVLDLIRRVWNREKEQVAQAKQTALGTTKVGPGADVYSHFGLSSISDYLRVDQDLMARYLDYENMESYAPISVAIDIYADNATMPNSLSGKSVWADSSDTDTQKNLTTLFDKNLRIEEDIWEIARSLCSFGNNYEEILVTPQDGVIGLLHLPAATMRRYEDENALPVGFVQDMSGNFRMTAQDVDNVIKKGVEPPSGTGVFEDWRVIHSRLRLKHRRSLYGSCQRTGTRIWTDKGIVEIQNIQIGDRVRINSYGFIGTQIVKNKVCNGQKTIYCLKTKHRTTEATINHPFLVELDGKQIWKQMHEINIGDKIIIATKFGDDNALSYTLKKPSVDFEQYCTLSDQGKAKVEKFFLDIPKFKRYQFTQKTRIPLNKIRGNIRKNHGVALKHAEPLAKEMSCAVDDLVSDTYYYSQTKLKQIIFPEETSKEFCRLFGFLLGDGWIVNTTAVAFAESPYTDLNNYYCSLFKKLFEIDIKHINPPINEQTKYTCFTAYSSLLVAFLLENGWMQGAHNKRIPGWVYGLPRNQRMAFLKGFLDADGEVKRYNTTAYNIELCNENLVKDLKTLIDGLGYKCGHIRKRNRKEIIYKNRKIAKTTSYTITFYMTKFKQPFDVDEVIEIKTVGIDNVWDIEIDHDTHNFIADGITSHNSILEPARWVYKRLLLLEDSMLIHRMTRAPSRFLFAVDMGDTNPKQFDRKLREFMNKFKKRKFVNPETGQLDLRHNPLSCFTLDTKIKLLDGRTLELKDLIKEHAEGKQNYVYSYDIKNNKVVPGRINRAEITRRNAKLVKVTLDNGEEVRCTPDHKWLLKSGKYKQAQYLQCGESLMADNTLQIDREIPECVNHKVLSVEFLDYREDTGCVNIDIYHNFFSASGAVHANSDEDFFVAKYKDRRMVDIETINPPSWGEAIEDVLYFRQLLVTALKMPKAYLGIEEAPAKAVLAHEDVRFAATVMRIQRELRNSLKQVARLHLTTRNIDPESVDFEVWMTIPSSIFELAQMEIRSVRLDLAEKMEAYVSKRWIMKELLGFNDEEIEQINKDREKESGAGGGVTEEDKKILIAREKKDLPLKNKIMVEGLLGRLDKGNRDHEKKLEDSMDKMLINDKAMSRRLGEVKLLCAELKYGAFKKNGKLAY